MTSAKDFWDKKLRHIDIESYDFSESNHEKYLDSFCNNYLQKGESVLDLGCGGGRNSRYLAGKGYALHGVDFSDLAVDFCRRVFTKLSLKGSFSVGTPDKIPFPDDYFSAAICVAVLDHVFKNTAYRAIAELRRVTKPGAAILITFDPLDREELFSGEAKQFTDGSLQYRDGEQSGLIFRKYTYEEIVRLVGKESIIFFDKDETGHRIVVFK